MNGKLAFGRCNTYFNVTFFFHAFVLCNVMGTDQTEESTVINNAFFFFLQPVVRLFSFLSEALKPLFNKL